MSIGVLIPYRGTDTDKSRLRKNLTSKLVNELLYQMTQQVIDASTAFGGESRTYLLTKSNLIKFDGDYTILEDQGEALNDAIKLAVESLKEEIVIIVMADLPLIKKDNLEEIVNLHKLNGEVIIAPSDDNGTSLLCFNSKDSFSFVFGNNSAIKYQEIFTNKNIKFKILEHEYCYRDIDTFKDLIEIKKIVSIPSWLKNIIDAVS
jgi:2-phospho-L-lactate guanylyltransferase